LVAINPHLLAEPLPVRFNDAVIEATIRQQLQKETGNIYAEELNNIVELRIEGGSVESLEDLTTLPKLIFLSLNNQQLADPLLLGQLRGLQALSVSGCRLTHASFVEDLTNLIRLDISYNNLTDINFVSQLRQLNYLNISNNIISDLTPLNGLTKLEILEAYNIPVKDWTSAKHVASVMGLPRPLPQEPELSPLSPEPEPAPQSPAAQPIPQSPEPKPTPQPSEPKPTPQPPVAPPKITANDPNPIPAAEPVLESTPEPAIIAVKEVALLSRTSYLLKIDGEVKLAAAVSPDNATDKTLKWSSSNSAVATVDNSGNVTAVGLGTATITVACGEQSARCSVTVESTE
jgi:hypothetical protein